MSRFLKMSLLTLVAWGLLACIQPSAARAQYYDCSPVVAYAAPVAPVAYVAPATTVSYYAPAPAVSYYAAPAVSYYAPAVSYYAPRYAYYAPAVSYYAPVVSYYAYSAPAVSYYGYGYGYGGYGYRAYYNPGGLGGPWSGLGVRPGLGFGRFGLRRAYVTPY
jgi:hypothetical protein